MNERKMLDKEMERFDVEYDTLSSILTKVTDMIVKYGSDATVQMQREAYSDSDQQYAYVFMKVPETDAEMALRIEQETRYQRDNKERELATLKRLQAKYGT
jgi:hypothetical protein